MTRPALVVSAVLALACSAGCTEDVTGRRTVHLESARAVYTESRPAGAAWDQGVSPAPEVEAKLVVDGATYGACKKRWTAFEMACALDVDIELGPDSRIELVVEDNDGPTSERMGAGSLAHATSKIPQRGRATLALVPDGSVKRSSVTLEARWEPRVPMSNARVIVVLLGAFAALVMYGLLRRRFLTVDACYLRSFAFVSAGLASLIAWVMMVPVLDHASVLEPLLVAAPMGLGAYALTAMIIDSRAAGRWGRRRIQVGFAATGALIALPLAMSVALISPKFFIVAVVIIAMSLFL